MDPNKNLYVIGADGYIGRPLYMESPFNTLGTTRNQANVSNKMMLFDLMDLNRFPYKQIQEGDVIAIAAAISSPDLCAKDFDYAWSINVTATENFIGSVLECGAKVIFFSSDTVYGERKEAFDEFAQTSPVGPYAIMKDDVERKFYNHPQFKVIRLSYVFSYDDTFTAYLRSSALQGIDVELFDPFCRSTIYRADVLAGVYALVSLWDDFPHTIINFGGPNMISKVEFANKLRSIGHNNLRYTITTPSDEFFINRPRYINMKSKLLNELLKRPTLSIEHAIRKEYLAVNQHNSGA